MTSNYSNYRFYSKPIFIVQINKVLYVKYLEIYAKISRCSNDLNKIMRYFRKIVRRDIPGATLKYVAPARRSRRIYTRKISLLRKPIILSDYLSNRMIFICAVRNCTLISRKMSKNFELSLSIFRLFITNSTSGTLVSMLILVHGPYIVNTY